MTLRSPLRGPLARQGLVSPLASRYGPSLVTAGLVAEWRFDDGSGQQLTDYSGNGHHGQLGSTSWADSADPTWTVEGLSFDVGDIVKIADTVPRLTTSISVIFVFRADSAENSNTALAGRWRSLNGKRAWTLGNGTDGADVDKLRVILSKNGNFDSNVKDYTSSEIVYDNQWHSVGFTFGSGELKIFLDGVEDTNVRKDTDADFTEINNSDQVITIGARVTSANMTGDEAYALIYNSALTPSEMGQNHTAFKSPLSDRGITLP